MGSQRVTIFDVAKKAGVSISSVSAALNGTSGVSGATRARILSTAEGLGFSPSLRARSLSGRRAFALGFVVRRPPDVLEIDPFFGAFLGGIEEALNPRDYALVLHVGSDLEESLSRYRRLAQESRVDGVFLSELTEEDPRVELVTELGLPAVGINPDAGFPLPAVRQDHTAAIDQLVDLFVERGHTSIGYVAGRPGFIHSRQRREAWESAIQRHGLRPGPVSDGQFSYEGGAHAAIEILSRRDRPTAVFCANDLSAMGFVAEAQRLGFEVPGDLAVAGFDGIELGRYVRPPIATIITSPRQLGRRSAELLLDLADGRPVKDVEVEPARLDLRGPSSSI